MSVENQLHHIRDLGSRFVRAIVDKPFMELLGRPAHRSGMETGQAPGTLYIDPDASDTRIRLWLINETEVIYLDNPTIDSIEEMRARPGRLWVDLAGFADDARIRAVGELFGLHPVVLADLVNIDRKTKVNTLDEQALIIIQALHLSHTDPRPGLGQMGLLLGDNWLLSFRERPDPLINPILARMERPSSRLRSQPIDYLASALLDVAVDASYPVVEALADQLDVAEEAVMAGRGQSMLGNIHDQRRALIALGRIFWRQRDLMARLLRDEEIFRRETHIYLRDVYDCTVQLMDMVETTRELAASLVEIHLSISANRTNEVMKTLTIMASIFIPLTFIAGIYGMNFEHMPELAHPWAYFAVLGFMGAVAGGLLLWFWRRGWLGKRD